jgi:hypothetical protein
MHAAAHQHTPREGGGGDHHTTSDDHCTPPKGGEPPDLPLNDLHAAVDDKLTSATGKSLDPPPTTTNSRVSLQMTTKQQIRCQRHHRLLQDVITSVIS